MGDKKIPCGVESPQQSIHSLIVLLLLFFPHIGGKKIKIRFVFQPQTKKTQLKKTLAFTKQK